ncbi:hypothetical protein UCRNP2_6588 [Neofusicoccum parvum UCRNP2]|uniref:RING-type domain-containing protein n=1 Tax=Botryosphaeria parva (strain UCR-NP2) TaxID=1287680 RepID=R1EGN6_BOTPV|nr:hypothetical protein UCRNP2_6588 [Neofusicoccum parvum UCRNP2]
MPLPTVETFLSGRAARLPLPEETCGICQDALIDTTTTTTTITTPNILACHRGHPFHHGCLDSHICALSATGRAKDQCPQCRARLFADPAYLAAQSQHWARRVAAWQLAWPVVGEEHAYVAAGGFVVPLHAYEAVLAAWRSAERAVADGDWEGLTAWMERAEEGARMVRQVEWIRETEGVQDVDELGQYMDTEAGRSRVRPWARAVLRRWGESMGVGRLDFVQLTSGIFAISNPKLTRMLVYAMEIRGISGFGPVWDS